MQHAVSINAWAWGRRLRLAASMSGSVLVTALWSAPVLAAPTAEPVPPANVSAPAEPHPYDTEPIDSEVRFDEGVNVYVSPGGINVPYGGRESVDYSESFDPGFQWGFGLGWFARTDSAFAIHAGAYFDHALLNAENRMIGDASGEHMFRAGLELEPGLVLGERVFLGLPLRGGYAANVIRIDREDDRDEIDADHGPMFGAALGMDIAILRGFYVGTSLGTDLHFFRSGTDYDLYSFAWRTRLGYHF
jgi:hypothetical protein